MRRSILIFGAGHNQYLLIQAANDLGLSSVVVDPNQDAPGKAIADHFYVVAGNDYETTKSIALKHHVAGLVTTQMEKPLRLMARLAQELGLPFHSPEVVERSIDKWLMKQAFLKNGVPCAKGNLFTKYQTINEKDLAGFVYPIIMKPKDATSSQGVFRIEKYAEIAGYLAETRKFTQSGDVIIEEFLEGPEYSIETITFRGKTTVVQYTEKFITPFPHTVEMAHLQPAELNETQKHQIDKVVTSAISALGIDNSAAHTEIKLTADGPKILEIGARGGGDFIASYLTLTSTGISMDEAIIKVALNEEPDLKQKNLKYSYIKYAELPVGKKVAYVEKYSDLLTVPDVVFAHIFARPGDITQPIMHSALRPACIIVGGSKKEKVITVADEKLGKLISKIGIE